MNITYTKCGDYLLPNLKLTEKENKTLNKYGLLRLEYLKNKKKALYQELLMKDKLNEHLFSVSIIAEDRINNIVNNLIELDSSITEKLKSENQLLWVRKMNNCKNIAEKIVLKGIVYEDEIWLRIKKISQIKNLKKYYYHSTTYSRNCLSDCPLINHINSALDIFNVRCNIDELILEIELILKIKYNLKVAKNNPLKLIKVI